MAEEIKCNISLNTVGKIGQKIVEFGLWLMRKGTSVKYDDPNDRSQEIEACIAEAFRKKKEENSKESDDSQV